jgi:hypothetical protein
LSTQRNLRSSLLCICSSEQVRRYLFSSNSLGIFLLVLAIGPVFVVDIPAMQDYPNHLARMYILSRDGTAAANPFYQVRWTFNTNLAIEIIVPPLAGLIGVAAATKAFYLISQLLVISGALALERVVKGRLQIAPMAVPMMLYSLPFAWGFVNFEFGLGAALWAIAMWLRTEGQRWVERASIHSIFVMILFAAHLFALGIYGFTVGVHELWRLRSGRASLRETAITLAMLAAPAVILLGITAILGSSMGGAAMETAWRFDLKPRWISTVLNGYNSSFGLADIILILLILAIALPRGYLRFTASGRWIVAGFTLLYVAMPFGLFRTTFNDARIVTAAGLILPGFVGVSFPSIGWRRIAFLTASACVLANLALVWSVWLSYRSEYAEMISSFDLIAKGSTVLIADSNPADKLGGDWVDYPFYHAPTLAAAYADALVPALFTYPGDRPVRLRPAYRHLAQLGGLDPQITSLAAIADGTLAEPLAYLKHWPDNYGYVYVVGPRVPNPLPLLLLEFGSGSRFVLYRINKAVPPNRDSAGANSP